MGNFSLWDYLSAETSHLLVNVFYVPLWVANGNQIDNYKKTIYMKNFVQELKWRGMIQDIMPGTEEKLMEGSTAA